MRSIRILCMCLINIGISKQEIHNSHNNPNEQSLLADALPLNTQTPSSTLSSKTMYFLKGQMYKLILLGIVAPACYMSWNRYSNKNVNVMPVYQMKEQQKLVTEIEISESISMSESSDKHNSTVKPIEQSIIPAAGMSIKELKKLIKKPAFYDEDIVKCDYNQVIDHTYIGVIIRYIQDLDRIIKSHEYIAVAGWELVNSDMKPRGLALVEILNTQYFTLQSYPDALLTLTLSTKRADHQIESELFKEEQENCFMIFRLLSIELQEMYNTSMNIMEEYKAFSYGKNGDIKPNIWQIVWNCGAIVEKLKDIVDKANRMFSQEEFQWGLCIMYHYHEIHAQAQPFAKIKKEKWLIDNAHKVHKKK